MLQIKLLRVCHLHILMKFVHYLNGGVVFSRCLRVIPNYIMSALLRRKEGKGTYTDVSNGNINHLVESLVPTFGSNQLPVGQTSDHCIHAEKHLWLFNMFQTLGIHGTCGTLRSSMESVCGSESVYACSKADSWKDK